MIEKKWESSKSIQLTKILVVIFGIAVIVLDITAFWAIDALSQAFYIKLDQVQRMILVMGIYVCSIPAYCLLWSLYRLLVNIEKGEVFTRKNISYLRRVSWCCIVVTIVSFVGSFAWISLIVIAIAAGFVALIVRVVKNVFERALEMKVELDYVV